MRGNSNQYSVSTKHKVALKPGAKSRKILKKSKKIKKVKIGKGINNTETYLGKNKLGKETFIPKELNSTSRPQQSSSLRKKFNELDFDTSDRIIT